MAAAAECTTDRQILFSGRNACGECLLPGAGDTIRDPTLASLE